jgi:hypothetical protein
MSTESAILLRLDALTAEVRGLRAELTAKSPTPWPDRMNTQEAVLYVRHAYRSPKFCRWTLYRWMKEGRLSDIAKPRRWLRTEIDALLAGVPSGVAAHPKTRHGSQQMEVLHGGAESPSDPGVGALQNSGRERPRPER